MLKTIKKSDMLLYISSKYMSFPIDDLNIKLIHSSHLNQTKVNVHLAYLAIL